MGALLQDFVKKYIWNSSSWTAGDDIFDTHGNIIHSFYTSDNTAGELVTERNALRNSTIYSSTYVRGNTIASLPCNVIKEEGGKKNIITDHAAYYLVHDQPNSYMSSANFWKTIMLHVDIWGNGYAYIQRDSRRNPTALHIWLPWEVTLEVEDGELFYHHNGDSVHSRDMLHYRFYSFDGVFGRSPVRENSHTIGMAMKLDRYSTILMGVQPPGILSTEQILTPEQRAQNKKMWNEAKPGQIRVTDGGFKYTPIMSTSQESAFEIQKRQNKTENKITDNHTFSLISSVLISENLWFHFKNHICPSTY